MVNNMNVINKLFSKLTYNIKHAGLPVFFREIVSQPKVVGAIFPSSKRLAKGIAKQVPIPEGNELILELGPGTGAITEALLQRGIPIQQLIAIERSSAMTKHMRKRFPGLAIIQGDASHLDTLLKEQAQHVKVIVSSLPLRSLPKRSVKQISQQIEKLLMPQGIFIQFTYSIRKNYVHFSPQLKHIACKWVFTNLPPARIDVFKQMER